MGNQIPSGFNGNLEYTFFARVLQTVTLTERVK